METFTILFGFHSPVPSPNQIELARKTPAFTLGNVIANRNGYSRSRSPR
ncbi:hypothetical protein [Burkholderia pyrrocinia]|nr:hypothetical protein [Burkholderia pyrrocinia]